MRCRSVSDVVHNPPLRGPDVGQSSAADRSQPGVLEREHGGRRQRRDELTSILSGGDLEAEDGTASVGDHDGTGGFGAGFDLLSRGSDPATIVRHGVLTPGGSEPPAAPLARPVSDRCSTRSRTARRLRRIAAVATSGAIPTRRAATTAGNSTASVVRESVHEAAWAIHDVIRTITASSDAHTTPADRPRATRTSSMIARMPAEPDEDRRDQVPGPARDDRGQRRMDVRAREVAPGVAQRIVASGEDDHGSEREPIDDPGRARRPDRSRPPKPDL